MKNAPINFPQATQTEPRMYNPDVHPLAMLDGMENPVHFMWRLAHEPLRNFFKSYCQLDKHGRLRSRANSHEFNRLQNKCYLFDETRQFYDLVQRELIPLVEVYYTERNQTMIERYHEADPQRKAALSNRLERMDAIIHEIELKGPRMLKYMAVMSLHQNTPTMNKRQWRLMIVRLEYLISLVVRPFEGGRPATDELADMLEIMEAATQAALRGYVAGGWGRGGSRAVALWPEVMDAPSVLNVGTGF